MPSCGGARVVTPALLLAASLAASACGVDGVTVLGTAAGSARDGGASGQPGVRDPWVLYELAGGAGDVVRDVSAGGPPLDLLVADPSRVRWVADGLRLDAPVLVASDGAAADLVAACIASSELTVEAWVTPAEATLDGTHRIVTLSTGRDRRNFTLGQGGLEAEPAVDGYAFRIRTEGTSANGLPDLSTPAGVAGTRRQHVVATHTRSGVDTLYVDGVAVAERVDEGSLAPWDDGYRLALGDELGEDPDDPSRAWLGTLHRVAIWNRALDAAEVAARHAAGL